MLGSGVRERQRGAIGYSTIAAIGVLWSCFPADLSAQAPQWTTIGPAPITLDSCGRWSGRVTDIAVDPNDPNHWLIGTPNGGIWETRGLCDLTAGECAGNASVLCDSNDDCVGSTWSARTDGLDLRTRENTGSAIGALAFAPSSPITVYAGTGDYFVVGFGAPKGPGGLGGVGILKSSDGGSSWVRVSTSGERFSEIKVQPTSPAVAVAATMGINTSGLGWRGP
jgi:hypothetical protein